jgi:hypothetical protein
MKNFSSKMDISAIFRKYFPVIIILVILFVLLVYLVYTFLPVNVNWEPNGPFQIGVDWKGAFRPAVLNFINGISPYKVKVFFNPPWVLLPLIPIALLPPPLGSAVIFVVNIFAYVFVLQKFKINILLMVPFIFLSGMLTNSGNGNLDGLIALGFLMPPQIGLFFVLAKPQIGIAVAVFWAVEAYRNGGLMKLISTFLPVSIGFILSFLIYGFFIQNTIDNHEFNNGGVFWPYGIIIGIGLLAAAIWKRKIEFAVAASPFFSPYLGGPSRAIIFLGVFSLLSQLIPARFRFTKIFLKQTYFTKDEDADKKEDTNIGL